MKYFYIAFLIIFLSVIKTLGQATVPFNCDRNGYLFQNAPTDVISVNLQTGAATVVKNDIVPNALSTGYNRVDNFIWGVNKTTRQLVKIDQNWNVTTFASNLPTNIHVADIDANGIFYGYSSNRLYRYDLNTNPPTELSTITTSAAVNVSDFAFNPIDGFIYGIGNSGQIFRVNPSNGSVTAGRTVPGITTQTYGAAYFDANGTIYISGNTNGATYKISHTALTNPSSTEAAVFFSTGPVASGNDGARCATAPLCRVGAVAPTLSQSSLTNTCNTSSVNLANISASNTPDGTTLTWHTGDPTTTANKLSNLNISTSGTYYATFFDQTNDCYSASRTPFTVTINPIPSTPSSVSVSSNSVCSGTVVNLSGSCSVGTLTWYENSTSGALVGTGSPLAVTMTQTKTYVSTCKTSSPACESLSSNPITITVNPKPNPPTIVAGSTRICQGTSTTLSVQDCSGTVNWSTGETGNTITISPINPTVYSATCTNAQGCVSNQSNSNIEITIAAVYFSVDRLNVCSGESVSITMGGCTLNREFRANGTQIFTSSTLDSYQHSPTANTIYTALCGTVAATSCATNQTTGVSVTVRTTPTAPVSSGTSTICLGSSATLTASGCAGTVNWSNSQTGNSISVSPSVTTSYTATCLQNGCLSPPSPVVTVTVETIPAQPSGTSNATICQNQNITLGGNCGVNTINWYTNPGLTSSVTMPVAPTSNQTYYAICRSSNCVSASVPVAVIVNPNPNIPTSLIANPSTICEGKSTVISGTCTGSSNIVWYTNPELTNVLVSTTVSPSATTIYYASCERLGCKSIAGQLTVTVQPSPTGPTGLTSNTTVCRGQSFSLTGACPSGSLIQWYLGVVDASSLLGTGSPFSVTPSETTIYVSTCKNSSNSCESPSSSNIVLNIAATPSSPTGVAASKSQICSGESVTLSGTCTTGTLRWYTNIGLSNEVTSPHSPVTTTTYYGSCVIGTCKSPNSNTTVTVSVTPTVPTGIGASNTTICQGQSTTLSGTCATGTLTWYSNSTLTTTVGSTVQPSVNTTYYAACINGVCKSTSGSILITVIAIPAAPTSITSSPTGSICVGQSLSLSGNCIGPSIIHWYADALLNTEISPATGLTPTTTTTYYSVCKIGDCVSTVENKVVEVNALPAAPTIIPSDRNLCLGGSIELTASGCTGIVNWTIGGVAGPSTAQITQTPTTTTIYSATCTNTTTNCISPISGTTTITVIPPPTAPSISISKNVICAGESVILDALNCSGVTNWFRTGTTASIGNTDPFTTTPTSSGTYYATCSTSGTPIQCESGSSDPIPVTVNAIPNAPTISTTQNAICAGSSTTLDAINCSGTVNWSNGQSGVSITVSPTANTSYTAKCILDNCESIVSNQINISVTDLPSAPSSLSSTPICSGQSSTLSGTCASGAIQWFSDAALTISVSSTVNPSSTQTYFAKCLNNNCSSSSNSVIVDVTQTPNVPTTSVNPPEICIGNSAELLGSCGSGELKWYSENSLTSELTSINVSPAVSTDYFAACINASCKSLSSTQNVVVNPLPAAPTLSASLAAICSGQSTTLTATGCTGTVTWSDLSVGNSLIVSPTGNTSYFATCTNSAGCKSLDSTPLLITVINIPDFPTIVPNNSEICPGGSVTLNASGCDGTITWFNSANASVVVASGSSLTVTPTVSTGYFTKCTTSVGSCVSEASESSVVTVKGLPEITDVLTPTCSNVSNSLVVFQTSDGAASNVSVTNGLSTRFVTTGRETPTGPDMRQVWLIENIPNETNFTITVTENGCEATKNYTTANCTLATAFPVDILWFKGEPLLEKISLRWLVANEVNIEKFEIEKSKNAVDFYKIGSIKAVNKAESHLYTYDDINPYLGVNYYRLKNIEFNGKKEYSKTIAINFSDRFDFNWTIFPNPVVKDQLGVAIKTNNQAELLTVNIYNSRGIKLMSSFSKDSGSQYYVTYGRLIPGVYILQVQTNKGFDSKKFVVQK
jgi:hypothetical protein